MRKCTVNLCRRFAKRRTPSPESFDSEDTHDDSPPLLSFCGTVGGTRPVCVRGIECTCRERSHMHSETHPFDPDYILSCEAAGLEPVQQSLRNLFTWVDADHSGKISPEELNVAVPLIERLLGEPLEITTAAWEKLDEDKNGRVNFSEFASWAGPRLGLPLGVRHLFSSSKGSTKARGCGVVGCPCECFVQKRASLVSGHRLLICECGHKKVAHDMNTSAESEVPYPLYWDSQDTKNGEFRNMIELGSTHLGFFQTLMDATYQNIWTRDRKRHNPTRPNVPQSYHVVRAFRSENSKAWRPYSVRRAELSAQYHDSPDWPLYTDVQSTSVWKERSAELADSINSECNEWYLFHGTNEAAGKQILRDSFKFNFAGGNTGSLYGRGIYFAESVVKADEYSKPNADDEFNVLLCRVLGGRVQYTTEDAPNAEELTQNCIEGPFDCVLGDRAITKGTFREFVLFDTENVYAEYMIQYRREGEHSRRDTEHCMKTRVASRLATPADFSPVPSTGPPSAPTPSEVSMGATPVSHVGDDTPDVAKPPVGSSGSMASVDPAFYDLITPEISILPSLGHESSETAAGISGMPSGTRPRSPGRSSPDEASSEGVPVDLHIAGTIGETRLDSPADTPVRCTHLTSDPSDPAPDLLLPRPDGDSTAASTRLSTPIGIHDLPLGASGDAPPELSPRLTRLAALAAVSDSDPLDAAQKTAKTRESGKMKKRKKPPPAPPKSAKCAAEDTIISAGDTSERKSTQKSILLRLPSRADDYSSSYSDGSEASSRSSRGASDADLSADRKALLDRDPFRAKPKAKSRPGDSKSRSSGKRPPPKPVRRDSVNSKTSKSSKDVPEPLEGDPHRKDTALVHTVLDMAKKADWTSVKAVVEKRPDLANQRPTERRFGLIHHGAYQMNAHFLFWLVDEMGVSVLSLTNDGKTAIDIMREAMAAAPADSPDVAYNDQQLLRWAESRGEGDHTPVPVLRFPQR